MIECVLAWVFLLLGIGSRNTDYYIASGVFAIAAQIYGLKMKGGAE